MTKEEAWRIIDACERWNTAQKSYLLTFHGVRTSEDDIHDARREALAAAWETVRSEEAKVARAGMEK